MYSLESRDTYTPSRLTTFVGMEQNVVATFYVPLSSYYFEAGNCLYSLYCSLTDLITRESFYSDNVLISNYCKYCT